MAHRERTKWLRSEWVTALHKLAVNCAESEAYQTQGYLRRMNELLMRAPDEDLVNGVRAIRPSRLEALLAVGAHETAAMAMLLDGAGYMFSRGNNGQSLATVALPGAVDEASAEGATPALALIAAAALSLSSAPTLASSPLRRGETQTRAALH